MRNTGDLASEPQGMDSSTQIGHPAAREESHVSLGTTVRIPNINKPSRREAWNQRMERSEGEEGEGSPQSYRMGTVSAPRIES